MIINFEGSGCTGKSSAITRVAERLTALGHEPVVVMNHVIDDYTAALRETLSKFGGNASELSKVGVYTAIWSHIQERIIVPARQNNQIVLLDRWAATTYFFQATAGRSAIYDIFYGADLCKTDLCIHLRCEDMSVITERLASRSGRNDRYNAEFIRESLRFIPEYIEGCKRTAYRYEFIDTSTQTLDQVVEQSLSHILPTLETHRAKQRT